MLHSGCPHAFMLHDYAPYYRYAAKILQSVPIQPTKICRSPRFSRPASARLLPPSRSQPYVRAAQFVGTLHALAAGECQDPPHCDLQEDTDDGVRERLYILLTHSAGGLQGGQMCSSSRLRVRAKAHTYTPLPLPCRIPGKRGHSEQNCHHQRSPGTVLPAALFREGPWRLR